MIDSLFVYAGFGLVAAGVVSRFRPLRFFRIRTRHAAAVSAGGLLIAAAALAWPVRTKQASARLSTLDEWMPLWQFGERHTIQIAAPLEEVFAAIRAVTADEISVSNADCDSSLRRARACGRPPSSRAAAAP